MTSLYHISEQYSSLLEAIEYGIIPEEAITDTLEAVEGELKEKIDSIACYIKSLRADIRALKDEENSLRERRSDKERKVEYLTDYIDSTLKKLEIKRLETARNKITYRKSSRVTILGENEFIEWAKTEAPDLLKFSDPEISLTAIKAAVKNGRHLENVIIEQYDNIQLK